MPKMYDFIISSYSLVRNEGNGAYGAKTQGKQPPA